ncbi:uncharacterized protein METZ01_LOCUS280629, partial [marine metagenome]
MPNITVTKEEQLASKKLVFIDRFINPPGLELLQNSPDVVEMVQTTSQEPDTMWSEISAAYGVHSGIRIGVDTEELIQRSPNLLAIVSGLAGYDSINVTACAEAGVLVCNQTGMGNEPV